MANEFHYCVSLSIVHPTVDPKSITKVITSLRPKIETLAGSERRRKDGTPIVPHRTAALSVWYADLHDEERLYSGDEPISDFILGQLDQLRSHASLFVQLREEGVVAFDIGLFSKSNCAAAVFNAETLKRCGDLGVDLELNFYSGPV
jgi:hypothetical protein